MAGLLAAGERVLFLQRGAVPLPPGTRVVERGIGVQMVADGFVASRAAAAGIVALGEEDAAAMLALATLTQPGPFRARTHELSQFWGVKDEGGRLLAMAGERLQLPGMSRGQRGVHASRRARARAGGAAVAPCRVARSCAAARCRSSTLMRAMRARSGLYEKLGFRHNGAVEALVVERI